MTTRPGRALVAALAALGLLLPVGSSGASVPTAPVTPQVGVAGSAAPGAGTVAAAEGERSGRVADPARRVNRVALRVLPALAQPGRATAPSRRAKHVGIVNVRPRRANVRVNLQVSVKRGWKRIRRARTNRQGQVVFRLPARRNGDWATYRARAAGKVSPQRSTARWGRPDFVDEFAGRKRLGKAWTHRGRGYNPAGFRRCSRGGPRAAGLRQGALRLSVLRDPKRRKGRCWALRSGKRHGPYAYRINGHVSTEDSFSFQYGFAAARVRFQPRKGQHGSFWLQPVSSVPGGLGPRFTGAEIDVVEWFGRGTGGLSQFTYHNTPRGKRVKTGGWVRNPGRFLRGPKDSWHGRYHVFSVEWTPKQYVFRIDGKVSWRSRVGVSKRPQFPILSLLSSDYEIAQAGDRGLGSQHMKVDWIKVWETGPR